MNKACAILFLFVFQTLNSLQFAVLGLGVRKVAADQNLSPSSTSAPEALARGGTGASPDVPLVQTRSRRPGDEGTGFFPILHPVQEGEAGS